MESLTLILIYSKILVCWFKSTEFHFPTMVSLTFL